MSVCFSFDFSLIKLIQQLPVGPLTDVELPSSCHVNELLGSGELTMNWQEQKSMIQFVVLYTDDRCWSWLFEC